MVCGDTPTDTAHWPYAIGMGRKRNRAQQLPTLPLCREGHTAQHWGQPSMTELLIRRASDYWRRVGEWAEVKEVYETWLSKRRMVQSLSS